MASAGCRMGRPPGAVSQGPGVMPEGPGSPGRLPLGAAGPDPLPGRPPHLPEERWLGLETGCLGAEGQTGRRALQGRVGA